MAVQKSKRTRSKKGKHRSNHRISVPAMSRDIKSNEIHIRHHITENGYYKGKKVI